MGNTKRLLRGASLTSTFLPWLLFLVVLPATVGQITAQEGKISVYSDPLLGFSFRVPGGMHDETETGKAEILARGAAYGISITFDLLLGMTSGKDSTGGSWHSLAIETYPRKAFGDLDDLSAESKMNAWVAGISGTRQRPRSVVLDGQAFAVSIFAAQDGPVRKGAVVWTTIRKGKLLSFAFVANSPQQLKALAESMKTVQFF